MTISGSWRLTIPEKETTRKRIVMMLLTGDKNVSPRKERKAITRKKTTNQKEENPRI
jgi:hypothetical protein